MRGSFWGETVLFNICPISLVLPKNFISTKSKYFLAIYPFILFGKKKLSVCGWFLASFWVRQFLNRKRGFLLISSENVSKHQKSLSLGKLGIFWGEKQFFGNICPISLVWPKEIVSIKLKPFFWICPFSNSCRKITFWLILSFFLI